MSVNSGDSNSYKVASIKRTACYGTCPEYEMTFHSNLSVEFNGTKNVDMIGTYTSKISQLQLEDIKGKFDEIGFYELEDKYTSAATDLPTTWVYYSDGKRTKTVMDYTGAPEKLNDLEGFLDQFIKELDWKKSN